jgi:uncharacterized membrane protein
MKDKDIESIIGWVLRIGVIISICIVFAGGVIYIFRHGHETPQYHTFKGVPAFVQDTNGILQGILTGRGRAIIQAGIILLIATPVIRVIFSAIGFIIEKDHLYTFITMLVLFIILSSMLSGHAG